LFLGSFLRPLRRSSVCASATNRLRAAGIFHGTSPSYRVFSASGRSSTSTPVPVPLPEPPASQSDVEKSRSNVKRRAELDGLQLERNMVLAALAEIPAEPAEDAKSSSSPQRRRDDLQEAAVRRPVAFSESESYRSESPHARTIEQGREEVGYDSSAGNYENRLNRRLDVQVARRMMAINKNIQRFLSEILLQDIHRNDKVHLRGARAATSLSDIGFTILGIRVSEDCRKVTVRWQIDAQHHSTTSDALQGVLSRRAGRLRFQLAKKMTLKFVPTVTFECVRALPT